MGLRGNNKPISIQVENQALRTKVDEHTAQLDELHSSVNDKLNSIGDLTTLTTTAKDSIVNSVNELKGNTDKIGDLTTLTTTVKDTIVNAINEHTAQLAESEQQIADIVPKSMEQTSITDVNVDEAICNQAQNALAITTYTNGTNEIVHPSVLFFPLGWNGYKYWMGYTCFDNGDSQFENPCIAVSNDNITWVTPEGLTNPIEPTPTTGYNADVVLFMSKDGKTMNMIFKYASPSTRILYLRTSTDGINWTEKVPLVENTFEDASPAVVWDGNQYKMWTIKHDDTPNNLYLRTSSTPSGPWSEPVLCNMILPSGVEAWHMDVKKVGNQYHMVLQTLSADPFYFGKSDDGINWTFGKNHILKRGLSPQSSLYKAAMFPMLSDQGLKYGIWYTTAAAPRKVYYTQMSFNRSKLLNELNNNVIHAVNLLSPWVFGDTFNREDSTTGLGVATSGQTWTKELGNDMGISSGLAYLTTAGNTRYTMDLSISDFYSQISLPVLGSSGYMLFRYVDANNYWRIGYNTNVCLIQKIIAGTPTSITNTIRIDAGDTIGVECAGNTIKVFKNGLLVHSFTDNTHLTGTKIGINVDNVNARFDNLIARKIV